MDQEKKYLTISIKLYLDLKKRIKYLEDELSKETEKRIMVENKCNRLEESNSKLTRIIDAIM